MKLTELILVELNPKASIEVALRKHLLSRDAGYVTMIDPFECKYGKWSAIHATIAASAEILAASSVMGALGSTLEVSYTT